jgi:hypothetical protein
MQQQAKRQVKPTIVATATVQANKICSIVTRRGPGDIAVNDSMFVIQCVIFPKMDHGTSHPTTDAPPAVEADDVVATEAVVQGFKAKAFLPRAFLILCGIFVVFGGLDFLPSSTQSRLYQPQGSVVAREKVHGFVEGDESLGSTLDDTQVTKSTSVLNNDIDATPTNVELDAPSTDLELARAFVLERRNVYEAAGLQYRWKLRGIGYLYHAHGLVLLASLPNAATEILTQDPQPKQVVTIRNVNAATSTFAECEKLTLWVRVAGPEIFAGAATAVKDSDTLSCHWNFEFDLRVPGTYIVDAKVLIWNGAAPIGGTPESQCDFKKGRLGNDTLSNTKHGGFQGFKMYHPTQMCCEICARTPHCEAWSTPFARLPDPWTGQNGCDLLFPPETPQDEIPVSSLWPPNRRRALRGVEAFNGDAHTNPTSYFCGCGWSFWFTLDFPCLSADLDDRVFMVQSNFTARLASRPGTETARATSNALSSLPVCEQLHERVGQPTAGRWIRDDWPDETVCPSPYAKATPKSKSFPMTRFDGQHPQCWHRENIAIIGDDCIEMNCRLIKGKPWISHLHKETEFFGVWRPYDCNYMQFTTRQLQECVTKRKIVAFKKEGASVAEFVSEFVTHRLENVTMFQNQSDPDAITIVYDTLSLLHKNGPDSMIHEVVQTLTEAPSNEEHYWISGFFLSSEREVVRLMCSCDVYFDQIFLLRSSILFYHEACSCISHGSVQSLSRGKSCC